MLATTAIMSDRSRRIPLRSWPLSRGANTQGLKSCMRQFAIVSDGEGHGGQMTTRERIDDMIRRRTVGGSADKIVICALKGLGIPAGTLPPEAPSVLDNPLMRPWLMSMDVGSEAAVGHVERTFCSLRESCLGNARPIDRLKAVDAVRRSLVVAVGRSDEDVARRAMALLNELGACDAHGRGLVWDECASLEALDAALDEKVRPLEYWLAIHHYECCWIRERRRAILERHHFPRVA